MPLDQYGRTISYLRIALTDQCNLRCRYCMTESMSFMPDDELMQNHEVVRLARIFAGIGFNKIRLTGGEPTLRRGIVEIVEHIAADGQLRDLAMTTNGVLLKHLARPLRKAGLKRINVSMDTLDPVRFNRLTRWGHFDDVWAGIMAAGDAGFPIKINAVPVGGFTTDDDILSLARLTLAHDWQVRFIEMMPFGETSAFQERNLISQQQLMKTIETELGPLTPVNEGRLDGEARCYTLPGAKGQVGFISSVTNPFCAGCNRARLTADGVLRLCLLRDKELPLLPLLRGGADDREIAAMVTESIWFKPWGHGLADRIIPRKRLMSEIGG